MSERVGVVACSTLYAELAAVAPSAPVQYVPQEHHEFPSNPPDDQAIATAVQDAVDTLDATGLDGIAVAYSRTNHGLGAVEARTAPLFVMTADDCVDLLRATDDPKADGVYYLTRGVIDRGIDARKLHRAYRGELEALIEAFEAAQADDDTLVVDWHHSDRIARLAETAPAPPASVDRFFEALLGSFTDVALVDTPTVTPFHRRYAERFARLVERYATNVDAVEVHTVGGTHHRLSSLVTGEATDCTVVPPGSAVGER